MNGVRALDQVAKFERLLVMNMPSPPPSRDGPSSAGHGTRRHKQPHTHLRLQILRSPRRRDFYGDSFFGNAPWRARQAPSPLRGERDFRTVFHGFRKQIRYAKLVAPPVATPLGPSRGRGLLDPN